MQYRQHTYIKERGWGIIEFLFKIQVGNGTAEMVVAKKLELHRDPCFMATESTETEMTAKEFRP